MFRGHDVRNGRGGVRVVIVILKSFEVKTFKIGVRGGSSKWGKYYIILYYIILYYIILYYIILYYIILYYIILYYIILY